MAEKQKKDSVFEVPQYPQDVVDAISQTTRTEEAYGSSVARANPPKRSEK